MKNYLALSLISLASCAPVLYLPQAPQYDRHHQQIIFQETANHPRRASATYTDEGIPLIKYDPKWMKQFPKEFQDFVIYHEVAHLQLGHVDPYDPVSGGVRVFESQADCHSLRYLKYNLNYTQEQLENIEIFAERELGAERANVTQCLGHQNYASHPVLTKYF